MRFSDKSVVAYFLGHPVGVAVLERENRPAFPRSIFKKSQNIANVLSFLS